MALPNNISAKVVRMHRGSGDQLKSIVGLSYHGALAETGTAWDLYQYASDFVYEGLAMETLRQGPPYKYEVFVREQSDYTIVASSSKEIVDALTARKGLLRQLVRSEIEIYVHAFVLRLMNKGLKELLFPDGTGAFRPCCISYLQVNTPGLAPAMDKAHLFGVDLAQSKILWVTRQRISFNRCALRFSGSKEEFIRFSGDGSIKFPRSMLDQANSRKFGSRLEELLDWMKARGFTN